MLDYKNYGIYTIDIKYLKYLYNVDSEVYYNPRYETNTKPFIGIVIGLGEYNYFIPMTSAKEKHKAWKNITNEHLIIYRYVKKNKNKKGQIYKDIKSKDEKLHIISVLDIKKMIPVPDGCYEKVIFENVAKSYEDLLKEEYRFCMKAKDKILNRAKNLYNKQKTTKKVQRSTCNFILLEDAMKEYNK